MAVNITYMGTKRELAPSVATVINQAQAGILLDAFSGMCSVGEAVGTSRQVWNNDVQVFPAEVARAVFASRDEPPRAIFVADTTFSDYDAHRRALSRVFSRSIDAENDVLEAKDYPEFQWRHLRLARILRSEIAAARPKTGNLFSTRYSNNYFGVHQAIGIDSICCALSALSKRDLITSDQRRWMQIALGRAVLKIANSTGHFAQYLKPRASTYRRYLKQRQRNVWQEWLFSMGEMNPVGHSNWRRKNRAFNEDSLSLIPRLARSKDKPSVVYADPPYTDDQYSRFYHLLDTLMLYDYPTVSGTGLYRQGRFHTPFSLKSTVAKSFDSFVASVAKLGADLVLSYPTNGLLYEVNVRPTDILKAHFRKIDRCYSKRHRHSTFGASKGEAKASVTEVVYLARV